MFFVVNDIEIASYADGNTRYMVANNVDDLILPLAQESNVLFDWFQNNILKINAGKCHLLVSTNNGVSVSVAGYKIDKSDTEKLSGSTFNKKLTFDDHISDISKIAGGQIPVLARVIPYMEIVKKRRLINAFFHLTV